MIELPEDIVPNAAKPLLIDFGFVQESAGGDAIRIDRPGNRMQADLTFPVMTADQALPLPSILMQAKSQRIRVEYPLQGVSQGAPGNPVVNGTDSGGRVLKLRNVTRGHVIKRGFWLNVIAADGSRTLHVVGSTVSVGDDGLATLDIWPPQRSFPADGDSVELAKPTIEGDLLSDVSWMLVPAHLAEGFTLTVRESR